MSKPGRHKKAPSAATLEASDNETFAENNFMTKNSTATANVIPFRSKELLLVERDGSPFVPMKPVVEGMGLSWAAQTVKLNSNKSRWGVSIIEIPSASGDQSYLCLPLRKLFGWLMSIHANKVKPELRANVIAFQEECDEALWSYWNRGASSASSKRQPKALPGGLSIDQREAVKELVKARVEALPKEKQAKGAITCWSALKSKFGCSYKEISPEQYADAVSLVARVELDGEYIEHAPSLTGRRFILSFDHEGKERVTPIPSDAYVMTHHKMLDALASGDAHIGTDELFRFVAAATEQLFRRSNWAQAQLTRAKEAGFKVA